MPSRFLCYQVFSPTASSPNPVFLFHPAPSLGFVAVAPVGGRGWTVCVGVLHRHVTLEHPPLLNVTAPVLRIQIDAWAVGSRGRRSYQNRGLNATWLRQETTSLSWLETENGYDRSEVKGTRVFFRDPSY